MPPGEYVLPVSHSGEAKDEPETARMTIVAESVQRMVVWSESMWRWVKDIDQRKRYVSLEEMCGGTQRTRLYLTPRRMLELYPSQTAVRLNGRCTCTPCHAFRLVKKTGYHIWSGKPDSICGSDRRRIGCLPRSRPHRYMQCKGQAPCRSLNICAEGSSNMRTPAD